MTRGVKVGVRSVLLVMLLVRRFQRTLLTRCSVVPPRERDGARSTMDGAAVQQARVLRFRSIPKRWTFVDVVVVDSGEELGPKSGEELQLCFAAAELPVALAEGALLRFTGTEEPPPPARSWSWRAETGPEAEETGEILAEEPPPPPAKGWVGRAEPQPEPTAPEPEEPPPSPFSALRVERERELKPLASP